MTKKEFIELLNAIYSNKGTKDLKKYSFDTNKKSQLTRVNNLILVTLLNVIGNIKSDKIDVYIDKKVSSIDLKLTILRAKIAELNNRKNDYKRRFTKTKKDYIYEADYSKIIHDLNTEIIDFSRQLQVLQEEKEKLLSSSKKDILGNIIDKIKERNIKINLQELSTYNRIPVFVKLSSAIKGCNLDDILDLAKKYKGVVEQYNRDSHVNLIPIGAVNDYYPSLKLLTDFNFVTSDNYLKNKEDCEKVLHSISKFQNVTLRDIKQLLEMEYTAEKLDGLGKMESKVNSIDTETDYDFLRLHQGKYDNNLAIQLRGYEQIYEFKSKQAFKTEKTLIYMNKLKRQISILRKKIYKEIKYWYMSQKLFNKLLNFRVDSIIDYDNLKEEYGKIVMQMKNYKQYILDAEKILEEVNKKYKIDIQECEDVSSSLGIDISLIDDITSNYYLACIDYIEREKVKREIGKFINSDDIKRSVKMKSQDEIIAEKIASSWTENPVINSIEFDVDNSNAKKKVAA